MATPPPLHLPPDARPGWGEALRRTGVMDVLAPFDPHVAGTPPLGLDVAGSDIDILCHAPDAAVFAEHLWSAFGAEADFAIRQWTGDDRPVIASFTAEGWPFEIFGSPRPVAEQAGWRHFLIEQRLLDQGGEPFRARIMALRHGGMKTEPAFAQALGLAGDPYAALLALDDAGPIGAP